MADPATPPLRPARPRRRGASDDHQAQPAIDELTRHLGELQDVVWAVVDSLAELKAKVGGLADADGDLLAAVADLRTLVDQRADSIERRLADLSVTPPARPATAEPVKDAPAKRVPRPRRAKPEA